MINQYVHHSDFQKRVILYNLCYVIVIVTVIHNQAINQKHLNVRFFTGGSNKCGDRSFFVITYVVALVINGLFTCEFAYWRLIKIYWIPNFSICVFWLLYPGLFPIFDKIRLEINNDFLTIQFSLIISVFAVFQ